MGAFIFITSVLSVPTCSAVAVQRCGSGSGSQEVGVERERDKNTSEGGRRGVGGQVRSAGSPLKRQRDSRRVAADEGEREMERATGFQEGKVSLAFPGASEAEP